MWIFSWVWSLLGSLGLAHKEAKILFVGLDNAGKTSLLYRLKHDRMGTHNPTQQPSMEQIDVGAIRFHAFDLGGHFIARKVWREYSMKTDACVFIIDSADRARFDEAKQELRGLLNIPELAGVPVLILLNKIDLPAAASEMEMRAVLELHDAGGVHVSDDRPVELFPCSILRKMGYKEGLQWLSTHIP